MIKIIPILLISITLSACAGSSVSTPVPEPLGTPTSPPDTTCSTPANWKIRYNRSGGIAGFNETLTLDSGGNLTVQSERPPVDVQKKISKNQVGVIGGLLAQACPFEMKPNDAGCADCFLYNLNVQMDGQTYVMLATDVTLTEDLHPLIGTLSQLLRDTEQ